ncbi:gamma-glutamyltransferase [Ferruginivarius sediminum]|uniref:Gamma-glutamyltranspeptidase n=1 Tax=Ferruginivarius sediminum TaxID=2661937 RepID=A0A369TFW2_9PROT|nr:gamma-glutamyltransferase [Ferruginivarius sediminum]RDD63007.1 hypothetical protein DRB17_04330 [Ferruginivarius sediminum]
MHRFMTSCLTALAVAATGLAACSSTDEPEVAKIETVSGFAGIAAADEPRAALVGRDILGQNGNAVDAATAMAFTMTVTLPSRVGLGGGGACVVHKRGEKATEALLFLPRRNARGATVPGLARGMAALHARYGLQSWAQVVSPAERLARFGYQVSRAFHTDLEAGQGTLTEAARSLYLRRDGSLPAVGDRISQPELSAALAGIRGRGAGYLYVGNFARRFAQAAQQAGAPLSDGDLRGYKAAYVEPIAVPFDDHRLYLPPPPAMGGLGLGQLWAMAAEGPDMDDPTSPARAHFLVEAWKRALSEQRAWMGTPASQRPETKSLVDEAAVEALLDDVDRQRATPAAALRPAPRSVAENAPTAGLTAVDRFGNMVACAFTMNGLFGSGKQAQGTGILLAGSASEAAAGAGLAPAIVANPFTGTGYLAASAAGGASGQFALVQALSPLESLGEKIDRNQFPTGKTTLVSDGGDERADRVRLRDLLALARLHHPGEPDVVEYEAGVPPAVLDGLGRRDHHLRPGAAQGRINAIYCPRGPRNAPELCQQATDPRAHGLAVRAQ